MASTVSGGRSNFPSHAEQLLGRIASIGITSGPVVLLFICAFTGYLYNKAYQGDLADRLEITLVNTMVVIGAVYIICRLVLLVLPFMSLRSC